MKTKFKKTKKVMLVLVFSVLGFNYSNAQACGGFGEVIKTVWEEVYTIGHPIGEEALTLIPVVGQNEEAVAAISDASSRFHNFVFNENRQSWATIGAREIPVLSTLTRQHGTLRKAGVGGVRIFTTSGMFWDRVEVTIEKTGGKAKTDIIICTWDMESGAKNNYKEYTFENSKDTKSKKFTINNVHGKSISVKLRNRSAANTFKYTIKTKGFLNINKQRARGEKNTASKTSRKARVGTVNRRN